MEPTTCSVCGDFDYDGIEALMRKAGTWGRVPYHWMSSDELRASAAGTFWNEHPASQEQSSKHCKTCGILRDAAESFLQGSALFGSNVSRLSYSVALQNPSSAALRKAAQAQYKGTLVHPGPIRRLGHKRSLKKLEDDGDGAYHSDGGDSADSWQSVGEPRESSVASKIPSLKLLLRCNLTPLKSKSQDDADEEFQLELFTSAKEPPASFPMIGPAGEVSSELKVEDYATTIKKWLQLCDEHHRLCAYDDKDQIIGRGGPMPTRILDISDNKSSLCESRGKQKPYITLSHCRGDKAQVPVTTKGNMAERMKNISFDSMPQNFQDAIQISRALGIQYLWVDSLCIVQDNAKDWQEQTAQMEKIYGFSYLNIAATRASGATQGFIGPRWNSQDTSTWSQSTTSNVSKTRGAHTESKIRQLKTDSFQVLNRAEPSSSSKDLHESRLRVRLAFTSSHESVQSPGHINSGNETAPLNQRAWFFQERILAPRTVHFHANELIYECREGGFCECRTLNHLGLIESPLNAWRISRSRAEPWEKQFEKKEGCKFVLPLWRELVEEYTTRDLTYAGDRLPALAGLASFVRSFTKPKDEYLAGLWRLSLGRDLLWEVEAESKGPRRMDAGPNTPPSWSWASLVHGHEKGGIKYVWEAKRGTVAYLEKIEYSKDSRFSVKSASCSLVDKSSPYGHVSGGSITVTGAMCAVALIKDTAPIPQVWKDQIPIKSRSSLDTLQLKYDDPRDEEAVLDKKNPTRGLIFCLYIGYLDHSYSLDPKTHVSRKGLILTPSKKVLGAAERIGCWTQFVEEWAAGKDVFLDEAKPVSITIV